MMFQPKSNDLFGLKRFPPINKTCTIGLVSIVLMNDRASSLIVMHTCTCCLLVAVFHPIRLTRCVPPALAAGQGCI